MTSSIVEVRKEAMIVIGNILTTIPAEMLNNLLLNDEQQTLLKDYLQGLNLISNQTVIWNILDTVEHMCRIDH